jgi:DNA-binding MarR family transcriptional regulator
VKAAFFLEQISRYKQHFLKRCVLVDKSIVDIEMNESEDKLEEVIYFLLDRTIRRVKQFSQKEFAKRNFGLTVDQWVILKRISESEGVSQVDISESTYKDPAAVTRIIDFLVKEALVERHMNEDDRRKFDVHLTLQGQATVDKIMPVVVQLRKTGIQGIERTALENLKATLNIIYQNMS